MFVEHGFDQLQHLEFCGGQFFVFGLILLACIISALKDVQRPEKGHSKLLQCTVAFEMR